MIKTHSRVWLITGCSTGFGRKLSEAVLAKGDRLIATARNVAQLKDLETSHPTQVLVTQLDVTNPESIKSSVAAGKEKFGRIDVLVNNAGYGLAAVLEDATDTQIRQLFETNFFGLLNVTRAVLPVMREQQSGHILNITSVGGRMSFPTIGIYSGTKFAVEGVSEALAQEVAGFGIKVTLVEPGAFLTDFARSMAMAEPSAPYVPVYKALNEMMTSVVLGDPAKAAGAMISIVDAEKPPLRLALGGDALHMIRQKLTTELESYGEWEAVSQSTAFDDPSHAVYQVPQ